MIGETIFGIFKTGGFAELFGDTSLLIKTLIMYVIVGVLMYLAVKKEFEPMLLIPIAFGMLLANLPVTGLYHSDWFIKEAYLIEGKLDIVKIATEGGLLDLLYLGVKLGIYPPLIFLGIGAMTDFSPLIANPKSLLLGAAAQLGVFVAFFLALCIGYNVNEASAIGIIGGADGPTAILVTKELAPHLLSGIAVAAYLYMALIPIIQPPLMKIMTTRKERVVEMKQLRSVSKLELVLFPVIVSAVVILILPDTAPLIGMLMLGNVFRVTGVVDRLFKTAQNELINIVTIFLGISVGVTANAENFLSPRTIGIILLGVFAFAFSTIGGLLGGKVLCAITKGKINPLIGSARGFGSSDGCSCIAKGRTAV